MAHLLCARLMARSSREPFAYYNGTFFKYQGKPKELFLPMCSQNSIAVLEMLGTLQKVSNYEIGGKVVVEAKCNMGSEDLGSIQAATREKHRNLEDVFQTSYS